MADGMGQLLRIARDEGHEAAISYVGARQRFRTLRGCARVGVVLDQRAAELSSVLGVLEIREALGFGRGG
jgi:hypothetical protein